jgi:hypothetical protein
MTRVELVAVITAATWTPTGKYAPRNTALGGRPGRERIVLGTRRGSLPMNRRDSWARVYPADLDDELEELG